MAVSKQFHKLCKYYNIKDAKFHDLRRQALTNFMKDKKLSVAETMYISGHSDPKMLLKTYNNLKLLDVSKLKKIGWSYKVDLSEGIVNPSQIQL